MPSPPLPSMALFSMWVPVPSCTAIPVPVLPSTMLPAGPWSLIPPISVFVTPAWMTMPWVFGAPVGPVLPITS